MFASQELPPELARRLHALPPEKRALLERKYQQSLLNRKSLPLLRRRDNPNFFPLSFAQERLWFLWLLEPDVPAWNRPTNFRLRGRLNSAALERALNKVFCRHEILRAAYSTREGTAQQNIRPWQNFLLPVQDLSSVEEDKRAGQLEEM